ncbi:MAG: NTP transferase domain-containing protein [Proteobacteria bacterium]|nr:NTP transferase domain-containing protein [Pseudomonadota bacterium]
MSEEVIVGVILAGGQGRRMGGREKFALTLAGERLVDIAARRLEPQVAAIVVASNREVGGGLAWCADIFAGSMGPLAGLQAGCVWATQNLPEARPTSTRPSEWSA